MTGTRRSARKIDRFRKQLTAWAAAHGRDYPWRHTRDPYRLLIAEFMLRRTRSEQVAGVYERFVDQFPTLTHLAKAPEADVKRLLYPLGLEHRADQMASFAAEAARSYGDELPAHADALKRIHGVGDYAANAVACFSAGARTPFVDVNVARVIGRIFGLPHAVDWRYATAATRRDFLDLAARCVPDEEPAGYHFALLDFGALVCRPRPDCPSCPMRRARICAHARAT